MAPKRKVAVSKVAKPKPNSKPESKTKAKAPKVAKTSTNGKPIPPPTSHAYKYEGNPDTGINYWLIKSEPVSRIDPKTQQDVKFPLSDLVGKDIEETWDGVRNYEARNNMVVMSKGDIALFYHSNCDTPGIVGEVEISHEAHVDETQFNTKHKSYDSKSTRENPKWWCVDVKFRRRFRRKLSLKELQAKADQLPEFLLLTRGRLSVIPVGYELYTKLVEMECEGDIQDDLDCEIDRALINVK
ncbi:hypothetical protein CLIB1423_18S03422 [[Candida] railenensis]|uniref:EVE domain-containing protein n=1 Tax=[Candida] railenensis TaxID=45579 RepID=A0A9P0QUY4_9ASCO|nr:hypothetical protein CLIB1423_18S03422 [[Candida] railenensis]